MQPPPVELVGWLALSSGEALRFRGFDGVKILVLSVIVSGSLVYS
jgi:hypothetical protein